MKTFFRFLSLLLFICLLFNLCSCSTYEGNYKPISSSWQQKKVLAKTNGYKIQFELIRFLFFNQKYIYDQGDSSYWYTSEGAQTFNTLLNTLYLDATELYATFDVMKNHGLDPEADNIEEVIDNYITADIEGGFVNNQYITGYGSVDAYKQALANNYSSDAVQRLFYRYSACLSSLYSYLCVNHEGGKTTLSNEELTEFLSLSDVYHFNLVYIPNDSQGSKDEAYTRIATIRTNMIPEVNNYKNLINVAFRYSFTSSGTMASNEVIEYGYYATTATLNTDYSIDLLNAIQNTSPNEISDIIEVQDGYYLVYGMSKDPSCVNDDTINEILYRLYQENRYQNEIATRSQELFQSISYTRYHKKLTVDAMFKGKI